MVSGKIREYVGRYNGTEIRVVERDGVVVLSGPVDILQGKKIEFLVSNNSVPDLHNSPTEDENRVVVPESTFRALLGSFVKNEEKIEGHVARGAHLSGVTVVWTAGEEDEWKNRPLRGVFLVGPESPSVGWFRRSWRRLFVQPSGFPVLPKTTWRSVESLMMFVLASQNADDDEVNECLRRLRASRRRATAVAVLHNLAHVVALAFGWLVETMGWGVAYLWATEIDLWPLTVIAVAVFYQVIVLPFLLKVERHNRGETFGDGPGVAPTRETGA